jgi:hypothetical protein
MRARIVILVLAATFTVSLIGCGGKEEDPAEKIKGLLGAVEGMFDAVKAKDYEKAVSYMDIDGICEEMRSQIREMARNLPEEDKKKMEDGLVDITPEKAKEMMIEFLKKNYDTKDFTYETTEISDHRESTATVTVKFTPKDGEPEMQKYPVKKIDGIWKVTNPGLD